MEVWRPGAPASRRPQEESDAICGKAVREDQVSWRSRGYLPHFEGAGVPQAVTIRLVGSLPAPMLAQIERDVAELGAKAEPERRRRIEQSLDSSSGACWLREPRVAKVVEEALIFLHERKYHLHAWVVMPNHVHALFTPIAPSSLAVIARSLKSFTAKEANRLLGRTGQFWQRESFDRAIRNEEPFQDAAQYIEANPVKAGLCQRMSDWPYGSARHRSNRKPGSTPSA
jgi:REP element-mobilizing transposase RayT